MKDKEKRAYVKSGVDGGMKLGKVLI